MLKGCRKQMIVLRGTGSEIFDEAYFILKSDAEKGKMGANASARPSKRFSGRDQTTMLLEANRILEENRIEDGLRSKSYYALRYMIFFASGLLVGIASVLVTLAIS